MSLIELLFEFSERFFILYVWLILGFFVGKFCEKRKGNTIEHAVNVIQNQPQLSWRPKYFGLKKTNGKNRDGFWVTRFKPKHIGVIAYVIFHQKQHDQFYLLMTLQNRSINHKLITVCEPPGGFYNGEYASKIPYFVSESAEREIERQINQGNKNIKYKTIYTHFMKKFNLGELPKVDYQMDANLWETVYREIEEEAGLSIKNLQKNRSFTILENIVGEFDTPETYTSIRKIHITGNKLISLIAKNNDEIIYNQWIKVQDINVHNNTVKTDRGIFPLSPYSNICHDIKTILNNPTSQQRHPINLCINYHLK